MSQITFNLAARCDKAGRSENQDNFWICPDLSRPMQPVRSGDDEEYELGAKGALLVVADGMGGMSSGRKASELVIAGIKARFSSIPESVIRDEDNILKFIKEAVAEADARIKKYASIHSESAGMGSTVALIWLLGDKAYCAWCGDSRIYCFNPQNTLTRLSHDHSFVQKLVDTGKIEEHEAFDHPDSNIITRSLGDSGEPAKPEAKVYPIHRRDLFMLCSDGLCGLLDDETLSTIIADNCTSSSATLEALWKAGSEKGWSDNATIEVLSVSDGGIAPPRQPLGYDTGRPKPKPKAKPVKTASAAPAVAKNTKKKSKWPLIGGMLLIGAGAAVATWMFIGNDSGSGAGSDQAIARSSALPDSPDHATPLPDDPAYTPGQEAGQGAASQNPKDKQGGDKKPEAEKVDSREQLHKLHNSLEGIQAILSAAKKTHTLSAKDKKALQEFMDSYKRLPSAGDWKEDEDAQRYVEVSRYARFVEKALDDDTAKDEKKKPKSVKPDKEKKKVGDPVPKEDETPGQEETTEPTSGNTPDPQ